MSRGQTIQSAPIRYLIERVPFAKRLWLSYCAGCAPWAWSRFAVKHVSIAPPSAAAIRRTHELADRYGWERLPPPAQEGA